MRFNDALLQQLELNSLGANTNINSARAAVTQARALRLVAAAALLPRLGSSASTQRSTSNPSGLPGGRTTYNNFQLGLDAQWELDVFGANRSALATAEALERASIASLGDVQVSITAELALDYIALRAAQARLAIAEENLISQRETLQITRWRRQAGFVTALDVEQARTATEQTAALVPALNTNIDQLSHALAVLTGRPPAALLTALATVAPVPHVDEALSLGIPAETLRQRADVRAAEQQVLASLARVDQAEAARRPDFSIGASLGLSALTLGTLTHGASVVAATLGSVRWPLFDGGAALSQVAAQRAALTQSQQAYRAVLLLALQDVEDALVALRDDRLKAVGLAAAADAAANAARLARAQYRSGLVDFQAVLQTQRTLLSAQSDLAGSNADVCSDHVRLYKALGGGWTPSAYLSDRLADAEAP
jgi:NodT family efflux transporter outer membrane factor (OMF) lipoprotein